MVTFSKLAVAAALSLAPRLVSAGDYELGLPADNCALDDFALNTGHGSLEQGSAFCIAKWKEGVLIKSIDIQSDHNALRGMIVTFTDDTYEEVGKMDFKGASADRRQKIELDPTVDAITKLQMWDNGWNNHDNKAVGKLILSVSNGQEISLTHDWAHQVDPLDGDVGKGGMLLGIAGRSGDAIDRLEFIFAKEKIKKRSIENMVLEPSIEEINLLQSNDERGFAIETLDEVHHINYLDENTQVTMSGDKTLTTSTTITKTTSDTFHLGMGFSFTAKMGVPLVADSSFTAETNMYWEETNTRTDTTAETDAVTRSWSQTAVAKPGEAVRCIAWAFEGESVDVSWNGDVTIEFEDGFVWQYPAHGGYNTAQYTRVNTQCNKESVGEARKALSMGAKVFEDGTQVKARGIGSRSAAKAARRNAL